jgi:hypothetical protein
MLQFFGIGNGRQVGRVPVCERVRLERVNPEQLAVEDMNNLGAEVGEAKPREFPGVSSRGEGGQVVEHKSKTGVRPTVQFANAGEGEQGQAPED